MGPNPGGGESIQGSTAQDGDPESDDASRDARELQDGVGIDGSILQLRIHATKPF